MTFSFPKLFLVLLLLMGLALDLAFFRTFAFPDPGFPLQKGDRVMVLPSETLTQTFTTSRDGLRRVEVLFGKFTLEKEDALTLELRDENCAGVLAQKTLSNQRLDSEYTHSFTFNRVENSANKKYCFAVTFTTNRPVTKAKAPRFFIDEEALDKTPYQITNPGGVTNAGAGPLAIRPGYTHASFWSNIQEFFDRMSQYKPVFLKGWFLLTFATLGMILTLATVILLIREEKE